MRRRRSKPIGRQPGKRGDSGELQPAAATLWREWRTRGSLVAMHKKEFQLTAAAGARPRRRRPFAAHVYSPV
ncbi:hypothetical protein L596_009859 [Steinernema carpocapsae]|uniref:Uncharacterized protein n=1 Tax=Steinernema carpocapsae TaxID=34508 RepID=A0A4U5PHD8_STECR|nr:hypothetical protein L596_009859 [Steinernema carpocapsae]